MKTKHTRKSAALAVRPSEKREALSKEEFAQHRSGMAAAIQLLDSIQKTAENTKDVSDEQYDAAWQRSQDLWLQFLRVFSAQSPTAQAGFARVLGEYLFQLHTSGEMFVTAFEKAYYQTNPPLTPTQLMDLHEKHSDDDWEKHHNGKALPPDERKQLAKEWLTEDRGGIRRGRGAAIAFVADMDGANGHFDEVVDSYLTTYARAGDKTRSGFRSILSDVLREGFRGITIDKADFYAGREFHGGRKGPQGKELAACKRQWLEGGAQ